MSVNITVRRSLPGTPVKAGPDIVEPLLVSVKLALARGRYELNENSTSRKVMAGTGPKNTLMRPTKLVEIIKKTTRYRGILKMYSRSYDKGDGVFTINSNIEMEVNIKDTRFVKDETGIT